MSTTRESVTLPDAPAIPGLRFRHFRGDEDYPAILAVNNGSKIADGLEHDLHTLETIKHTYGTTRNHGGGGLEQSLDTIYRIDSRDGAYQVLHRFSYEEGRNSAALVEGRDGALYGVASHGGRDHGTLYRFTLEGDFRINRLNRAVSYLPSATRDFASPRRINLCLRRGIQTQE